MTVIARTHAVSRYLPGLDQAVSLAADNLRVALESAESVSSSWTEQRPKWGERTVLDAVNEARQRGVEISQNAVNVASNLIWALPEHVPLPDVVVEEDGDIALDWNESRDRGLTVSVNANGYLGYSALIGLRPNYGRAPFAGSIPDTVLFNLLRVYPLPTVSRHA